MNREILFVAFSTQKGGMGKTAVTVLVASYLHYVKRCRVAMLDCDFPQHSIVKERKRDEALITGNGYFKRMAFEMYRTGGVKAYRVKGSTPEPAIEPKQSENTKEVKESKETKEPVRRKKNSMDYGSQFLQRNELKMRSCVYISQKVHSTISEIVKNISAGELTVGGYIDSILIEHLETHKEAINELYRQETAKKNNIGLIDF